jgi:protein Tex
MTAKHIQIIAEAIGVERTQFIENTIELLKEGATVPFISRYRKERTGSMDEVQIGQIKDFIQKFEELEKRRESIIKSIEEQGKLTDFLRKKLEDTYSLTELEDLYLPYKKKRKTRASIARELGLEPLANLIFEQKTHSPGFSIQQAAKKFVQGDVKDIEEALQGARDIIAENINEDTIARNRVRNVYKRSAVVRSKLVRGKEEEGSKYKDYFEYEEPLNRCPSHRLLAIRRAEDEGILRVYVKPEDEEVLIPLEKQFIKTSGETAEQLELAIKDSYKRLLGPSIENEFRNLSKDKADEEAIQVFAENLRQLLLASPLGQKRVLALDPGFRTGCKLVCLNEQGALIKYTAIYPNPPQSDTLTAQNVVRDLVYQYEIQAIAIGNGTASRETERFIQSIPFDKKVDVFMVNENGASIYSASEMAREEFPQHDVTVRGAVSIGRRLMDPLAELVKIDAKSIGVGQYQHDVNQTLLKKRLDTVVESCVNTVGINVNTASKHLLTYVSGLGEQLAQNIVAYRDENGAFTSRKALMKVPRMGAKAFEQAAGFLRIRDGKNPLDNTGVHPEAYHIVEQMAKDAKCSVNELIKNSFVRKNIRLQQYTSDTIGLPTLHDIMKELDKPGLDPRGEAKGFNFTEGINSIEDVRMGMVVNGIISNITKFGAFVDIGIKESALIHVSQMANRFISDPMEVVKLQQHVQAKVISIDIARKRIQLSLKES